MARCTNVQKGTCKKAYTGTHYCELLAGHEGRCLCECGLLFDFNAEPDEPNFQKLGRESIWTSQEWNDAWIHLRDHEPNPHKKQAIWEAALAMASIVRPMRTVVELLRLVK